MTGLHAAARLSGSPEAAHDVEGLHAVEVEAEQQSLGHHAQAQGAGRILPAVQWVEVFRHAPCSSRLLWATCCEMDAQQVQTTSPGAGTYVKGFA